MTAYERLQRRGDYKGRTIKEKIIHNTKYLTDALLPDENRDWLINALETAYPGGHTRIAELKKI